MVNSSQGVNTFLAYHMGTRNEERHVPPATYNSKEKTLKTADDLGTSTYEGKPNTLGKATR